MRVVKQSEAAIDLTKKHLIEFTNSELTTLTAAIGSTSDLNIEGALSNLKVFTKEFGIDSYETDSIYEGLKEILKKENIVREDS